MHYNTIFSQLFQFIPRYRFEKSVETNGANRYCKHFTAWRQFLTCLYAQITGKDSLREICDGLLTNQARLIMSRKLRTFSGHYHEDAIGLLICKRKNKLVAEYSLKSPSQLLGISEYKLTKLLPDDFKPSLPSIKEIESQLARK